MQVGVLWCVRRLKRSFCFKTDLDSVKYGRCSFIVICSQIVRPPIHGIGGTISLTCIYSDRALDCRKHIMCREIRQRLFTSTMVFWDAFRSEEVISFKADLDSVTCIRSLYGLPSIPGIG